MSSTSNWNPKVRAQIHVTPDTISYLVGHTPLNKTQVEELIRLMLEKVFDTIKAEMIKYINTYVASDRGLLRKDIILLLETMSKISYNKWLKIVLGTEKDYYQYVRKMGDDTKKHYGTTKSGKKLYAKVRHPGKDPKAIADIFPKMRAHCITRMKYHFKKIRKDEIAAMAAKIGQKVSAKPFADKIKVEGTTP